MRLLLGLCMVFVLSTAANAQDRMPQVGPVDISIDAIGPSAATPSARHLRSGTLNLPLSRKRVLDDLLRDSGQGDCLPTGTARQLARIYVGLDLGPKNRFAGLPLKAISTFALLRIDAGENHSIVVLALNLSALPNFGSDVGVAKLDDEHSHIQQQWDVIVTQNSPLSDLQALQIGTDWIETKVRR